MANMLVTGGAGFIGSNFVYYWLAQHPADRLVVLDALTYAGNAANLSAAAENPQFRFVRGDIRDQALIETLLRDERLDTLVHFAAESHVDRSIQGPDAFIDTNINGTHCLLKAARAVWLADNGPAQHRFHHVSTDEVFGSLGPKDPAFTEMTPYTPNSPYSASKAASDHLVRAYHHTYGLQVTTSNCSNNYGPFHFPEKLIPLCIVNILHGRPLPIYGNGLNIRDWLYVEDHCRGIELILQRGRVGETYNLGGVNERANIDIVRDLCQLVDEKFAVSPELCQLYPKSPASGGVPSASLITYVKDRPGHDQRYAVDTSKVSRELGYHPRESFVTGLQKTVDWYLANPSWWRDVLSGSYRDWVQLQYG